MPKDLVDQKAAAFRTARVKARKQDTAIQDSKFARKVFLGFGVLNGIPSSEINDLWRDHQADPVKELRYKYGYTPWAHNLYPFRKRMTLQEMLAEDFKESTLWKYFRECLGETTRPIVVYTVGKELWVLTNQDGNCRIPLKGRIVFPASGRAPDAYAIPFLQYIAENKEASDG